MADISPTSPCCRGVSIHWEKMRRVEVRPLEPALYPVAADLITDALLHDPGFGFEEIGSEALPRGARMWFMRRP
jgi:hypothetical protein